jgi:hypothetical protein
LERQLNSLRELIRKNFGEVALIEIKDIEGMLHDMR